MADTAPTEPLDSTADELAYRPMEAWPIAALLLGLAAPTAVLAQVLLLVPVVGVLVAGIALARIAREKELPGRGIALFGLALSLFFLMLTLTRGVASEVLLARQARPVADRFFELLRERQPQAALMLHLPTDYRHPLDEDLWVFYRNEAEAKAELQKFVSHPLVRAVLALGDRAEIRYVRELGADVQTSMPGVGFLYAVTFTDDDGRKKTLFCHVLMERRQIESETLSPWRVKNFGVVSDPNAV